MDRPLEQAETTEAAALPRVVLLVVGIVLIAGSTALGVWVYAHGEPPFAMDVWWNTFLAQSASPFLLGVSEVMDWLGGGWIGVFAVPGVVAILLVVARRPWGAVYFVIASLASAVVVQWMKQTVGRARPEDVIVTTDVGSYPSGHVANAATIAVALAIIFPRVWVWIVGAAYVLLMAFSRTYLHAHWLSDTIGGAAIGAGVSFTIAAAFAVALAREPRPRLVRAEPTG